MEFRTLGIVALFALGTPWGRAPTSTVQLGVDSTEAVEPMVGIPEAAVPGEPGPAIELETVRWTVPYDEPPSAVASRFGVTLKRLVELNPELAGLEEVPAGSQVEVFRADPELPTQSIGAPNKGKLRNGIPLPEGEYWDLRQWRVRAFGTSSTIRSLVAAFHAYGRSFPDGPKIMMGEISSRRGGRASPHVSHRTGRDVDIGYILKPGALGDRRWRRADEETFDVEKNWVLIRSLLQTGNVQQMFVSTRLQRLLLERAKQDLAPEELPKIFSVANTDYDNPSIIRHWKGHRDHLHVRFHCEAWNDRCRAKSAYDAE